MIINGKAIAEEVLDEIKASVANLSGRKPGLAFILIGENPASHTYVRSKKKACSLTGIESYLCHLPADTSEKELLAQIESLNEDPLIDGILVQLPLPSHIRPQLVMQTISPEKDVDGFHPINVGKMLLGDPTAILPCTPRGIQMLLEKSGIPVSGKHVVIAGRSNIVGKPLAAILMQKKEHANATVTICHSKSTQLPALLRSADIFVAAVGSPHAFGADLIRPGTVVIDVGISRIENRIVGDVRFDEVAKIASHITPVPGGVGPMTIAMLLQNTLERRLANGDMPQ
jgi:methylenetetrahydrofolate dehydrogenase (NADP+)/methenyltetrahydrofolate cyclohydrolase